jgi:predicted secreted protein
MKRLVIAAGILVLVLGGCIGGGDEAKAPAAVIETPAATQPPAEEAPQGTVEGAAPGESVEHENCGPNGGITIYKQEPQDYSRWIAFYGGVYDEEFENVVQGQDGSLLAVGGSVSYSCGEHGDAIAVKFDEHGNLLWAKTYGGDKDDMLIDVVATPDNGYLAVGWTDSFGAQGTDVWAVKLDKDGQIEWQNRYSGPKDEQATSVDIADDGSFVLAGGTTSFGAGGSDIWVVKLSPDGDIIWQNAYGGSGDDAPQSDYGEFSAGAFFDTDGYVVVGASTTSFGDDGDVLVLKLDAKDGSVVWQHAYGSQRVEGTWTLKELRDGDYLLPGIMEDPDLGYEESYWIAKLKKEDGSIEWQKKFGMPNASSEPLNAIATIDGGLLIAGYYEKGDEDWYATALKMDAKGNILWAVQEKKGSLDYTNDVIELRDGSIVGVGVYYSPDKDGQLMAYRLSSSGDLGVSCGILSNLNYKAKDTNTALKTSSASVAATDAGQESTSATGMAINMVAEYACHG